MRSGYEGHQSYAPCTVAGLISKRYDYWALGQLPCREVLNREPEIIFPETCRVGISTKAGAKACMLVEVDSQQRLRSQFRPLDVFRWQTCWVDASGAATKEELLNRRSSATHGIDDHLMGIPLAVAAWETSGPCPASRRLPRGRSNATNDVRAAAIDLGSGHASGLKKFAPPPPCRSISTRPWRLTARWANLPASSRNFAAIPTPYRGF